MPLSNDSVLSVLRSIEDRYEAALNDAAAEDAARRAVERRNEEVSQLRFRSGLSEREFDAQLIEAVSTTMSKRMLRDVAQYGWQTALDDAFDGLANGATAEEIPYHIVELFNAIVYKTYVSHRARHNE